MELMRPGFCTIVMPYEYDYIKQFNESMKAANKFHHTMTVDPNCPPPYFPVDMGKVYGLLSHIAALESQLAERDARLKEAEAVVFETADIMSEAHQHLDFCGYGDSYERELARKDKLDERLTAAEARAAAFLAGGE